MVSLRVKLLSLIFTATFLAWSGAAYRSYLDTRHEINELFDAHLSESARAILQQAEHERREREWRWDGQDDKEEGRHDSPEDDDDIADIPEVTNRGALFEKRLYFQLRNASGQFLMGSMRDGNVAALTNISSEGFSEAIYNGESIRVFSGWNRTRTLNVQVGESMKKRNALIGASVRNVLAPILLGIVPLLLLLGIIVEFALRPIRSLAREVEQRTPENLESISDQAVPAEIRPMTEALNHLFSRLSRALANERRFTADAAHELRTPLAAIKVQAQVALKSGEDETTRNRALLGVTKGVDRATHLVEQLLTLARLDPETAVAGSIVKLRQVVVEVTGELAGEALNKAVECEVDDGPDLVVSGNAGMLRVLVRNLLDNAIRYSATTGHVHIRVEKSEQGAVKLVVEDNGPGLSKEQAKEVTKRFSRVSRPSGDGSGLGLSIVGRIAELHKATLTFGRCANGTGCRVEVLFPQ